MTFDEVIEMNELQQAQMLSFKKTHAGFSAFMLKQGSGEVPSFSKFITVEREDELMQAWLHPELIKVID